MARVGELVVVEMKDVGDTELERQRGTIIDTLRQNPDLAQSVLSAFELANIKDKAYGEAWRRQGYMGNLARVMSKSERLRNMLWCDVMDRPEAAYESTEDTLLDLINLAGFMLVNLKEGNRWGN